MPLTLSKKSVGVEIIPQAVAANDNVLRHPSGNTLPLSGFQPINERTDSTVFLPLIKTIMNVRMMWLSLCTARLLILIVVIPEEIVWLIIMMFRIKVNLNRPGCVNVVRL